MGEGGALALAARVRDGRGAAHEEALGALRRAGPAAPVALSWLLDQGMEHPEAADAAAALLTARPDWAEEAYSALARALGLDGPAAIDAEALLRQGGPAARSALEAVAALEVPGAALARGLLKDLQSKTK